jgi:hypothetical protein
MASRPSPSRLAIALALAGSLWAAGGCATSPDAPNADDATAFDNAAPAFSVTPAPPSDQGLRAEAFYSCLLEAGLPATINRLEWTGDAEVDFEREGHDTMLVIPRQSGFLWAGKSGGEDGQFDPAEQALWQQHVDDPSYFLVIDGVDHSDVLESCLQDSGYVDPGHDTDPAEELADKQPIAEATNTWIACAREHGMPDLEDPTVQADNYATYPAAVIPLSTTAQELRALLEVCPNFDEDQARRQREPGFNWDSDYIQDPTVWIEVPTDSTDAHFLELSAILREKSEQFWDSVDAPD